ncbi:periplasmiC nitrate reductase, diheme cytochrome c subunit, partial [Candidatus Thiomargarita nelsonii]
NELANIAPLRYFCTQCHAPQVDAKPLVENTFQPVQTLR